jgi:7-cyano-7-deazaguanine synthase
MKTVVLLSGGLDSATLLWQLLDEGDEVACLSVDYGQRHVRELNSSRDLIDEAIGQGKQKYIAHKVVSVRGLGGSVLLADGGKIPHAHYEDPSQQVTVVPGRNLIMLAAAAGFAQSIGFDRVAFAAHAGDHAIYKDCRIDFIAAVDIACRLGYGVSVVAPFSRVIKSDIARRAVLLNVPIDMTWTCYEGRSESCGKCGACIERDEALASVSG